MPDMADSVVEAWVDTTAASVKYDCLTEVGGKVFSITASSSTDRFKLLEEHGVKDPNSGLWACRYFDPKARRYRYIGSRGFLIEELRARYS